MRPVFVVSLIAVLCLFFSLGSCVLLVMIAQRQHHREILAVSWIGSGLLLQVGGLAYLWSKDRLNWPMRSLWTLSGSSAIAIAIGYYWLSNLNEISRSQFSRQSNPGDLFTTIILLTSLICLGVLLLYHYTQLSDNVRQDNRPQSNDLPESQPAPVGSRRIMGLSRQFVMAIAIIPAVAAFLWLLIQGHVTYANLLEGFWVIVSLMMWSSTRKHA